MLFILFVRCIPLHHRRKTARVYLFPGFKMGMTLLSVPSVCSFFRHYLQPVPIIDQCVSVFASEIWRRHREQSMAVKVCAEDFY